MSCRVLMVDDNENDLLFTRIALQRSGVDYQVRAFERAQEALQGLKRRAGRRQPSRAIRNRAGQAMPAHPRMRVRCCGRWLGREGRAPSVVLGWQPCGPGKSTPLPL